MRGGGGPVGGDSRADRIRFVPRREPHGGHPPALLARRTRQAARARDRRSTSWWRARSATRCWSRPSRCICFPDPYSRVRLVRRRQRRSRSAAPSSRSSRSRVFHPQSRGRARRAARARPVARPRDLRIVGAAGRARVETGFGVWLGHWAAHARAARRVRLVEPASRSATHALMRRRVRIGLARPARREPHAALGRRDAAPSPRSRCCYRRAARSATTSCRRRWSVSCRCSCWSRRSRSGWRSSRRRPTGRRFVRA